MHDQPHPTRRLALHAAAITLGLLQASALGDHPSCDERTEVPCSQSSQIPNRYIGMLSDVAWNHTSDTRGTAFLVSAYAVLTSGHCVFERRHQDAGPVFDFALGARFRPGLCMDEHGSGVRSQFPARTMSDFDVVDKYGRPGTIHPYKYDLGVGKFTCPYDEFDTFMPVVYNHDPNFAHLIGYPGFAPGDPEAQIPDPARDRAPWRSFGETDYEGGRVVKYRAKGSKGSSGSPVMGIGWDGTETSVWAYAVNSTGFKNLLGCDRSGGPRFTDDNRALLESWMRWKPTAEERAAAGCPEEEPETFDWFGLVDLFSFHQEWLVEPGELGLIDPPPAPPLGDSPYQIMQVIKSGFYEFAVFHLNPHDLQSPRFIQLLKAPGRPDHEQWRFGLPWAPSEMGFLSAFEAQVLISASMARDQAVIESPWQDVPIDPTTMLEAPPVIDDLDSENHEDLDGIDGSFADQACATDLNGDGATNSIDLGLLLGAWGPDQGLGDVNDDGMVDALDLGMLMAGWGPC